MSASSARSELTERPTKRRAGAEAGGLPVADPRPRVVDGLLRGARCVQCRHPLAQPDVPWCPVCFGAVEDCGFAPVGVVWSATTVRIPVGRWAAPFGLAYLDVVDGPRVLVHVRCDPAPRIGERIEFTCTDSGDLAEIGLEREDNR
ncbi:OB-fold domain-containing protein [Nocardia higoensis]|uniref:OB-fold domain-containing protein n=1 Tax=Nocardia higoensis TaxID=228599 RepID=UPI000302F313|nr:OB-fold domain-containing protein [Nocardia higoensis]